MNERGVIDVMSGEARGPGAAAARALLGAVEPAYGLAIRARNGMFERGWRRSFPLGRPTVCVGNITTGGTGKTPMVMWTVRQLQSLGARPAVLLRGYGQDETLELAAGLPGVTVHAGADRVASAQAVLEGEPQTTAFVLDDGFQHRRARRDVDLVLVDATRPFGFGHLLPRGLLREPLAALRRASGVIVTRADQVDAAALAKVDAQVQRVTGRPPIAHAAQRWGRLMEAKGGADVERPVAELKGMRVLGVSGLGNPANFERAMHEAAGTVVGHLQFGDHHAYTPANLRDIFERAAAERVDAVLTTQKDWVKWAPTLEAAGGPEVPGVPVLRPIVEVAYFDGAEAVVTLLREMLNRASANGEPGQEI